MGRKKKNRDINVFSASAIDLFASSMGVFIILVVVLFPYFGNKSKIEITQLDTTSQDQSEKVTEQQEEISKLLKKIDLLSSQSSDQKALQQALAAKDKEIEKLEKETKKDIREIMDLKNIIEELQKNQSRNIASIDETNELKKKILELQQSIKGRETENKSQISSKEKTDEIISELKNQIKKEKSVSSQLEEKLKRSSGAVDGKSFLAVVLKWSTEKHDVDLILKTPDGKVYDYKNKKYSNSYGEFVLDSRSGPGAEVWQTEQLTPGRYKLTSTLYNTYGNKAPAEVSASLFSKKGKTDVLSFKLSEAEKTKTITFQVDMDGNIKILK